MCCFCPLLLKGSWIRSALSRVTDRDLFSWYCSGTGFPGFPVSPLPFLLHSPPPCPFLFLCSSSLCVPSKNYKLLEGICHFAVESTIHLPCLLESGKSQYRFFSRPGFLFPRRWRILIFTTRKYFVLLKWQLWQCNIIVYLQPSFRNPHGFLSSPSAQLSCLSWLPDFLCEFSLT